MTDDLSNAERAELEELRRKNAAAPEMTVEKDVSLPPTHWLHLANGDVITSNGVKSIHEGIPVIAHYEIPADLNKPAGKPHVF